MTLIIRARNEVLNLFDTISLYFNGGKVAYYYSRFCTYLFFGVALAALQT